MARASTIFLFWLLLIVDTEALKLRKSHAHCAQNASQFELQKLSTNFVFLGIQKLYSFTLTPSCVDVPCYRVQFSSPLRTVYKQFPLLQTFGQFCPRRGAYKRVKVYKRGARYCGVILKKWNVRAIPYFVNIRPGLRGIPSNTAARETDINTSPILVTCTLKY